MLISCYRLISVSATHLLACFLALPPSCDRLGAALLLPATGPGAAAGGGAAYSGSSPLGKYYNCNANKQLHMMLLIAHLASSTRLEARLRMVSMSMLGSLGSLAW